MSEEELIQAMDDEEILTLKRKYNYYLKRFYNGCSYCEQHREEIDKWIPELLKILSSIEIVLATIKACITITDTEILEGFDLDEAI